MDDLNLPLNPRDYLILFALSGSPRHGYGLLKDIADVTDGAIRFDPANLYRSLKRMMKEGTVAEVEPPSPDAEADAERRRYYALTATGERMLRAEAGRLARLTAAARSKNLVPDLEPRQ